MKRRVCIPFVILLVALSVLAGVWWGSRGPLSAVVQVVDADGAPVKGAVIQPDGLRHKGPGSGHYGWSERYSRDLPPKAVTTDENGKAKIVYPRYVVEKLETREVSMSVRHPDFPPERPFIVVDRTPPSKAGLWGKLQGFGLAAYVLISGRSVERIELKRPATIVVKATLDGKSTGTNLFAVCSTHMFAGTAAWSPCGNEGIQTRQAAPGANTVFVYHRSDSGRDYFAPVAKVNAVVGETNLVEVQLELGRMIEGIISTNVPRPVQKGRVVARLRLDPEESMFWSGWADAAEDGKFQLPPFPGGEVLLAGMCAGFVSKSSGPQTLPQKFAVEADRADLILEMEPTATAEIIVIGPDQKALEGASVRFSPNVQWGNASTILMSDAYDSRALFIKMEKDLADPEPHWTYGGKSDASGLARVENLPENSRNFGASHKDFEMPIQKQPGSTGSRNESIILRKGEVTRVTVRMQARGAEVLE